MAKSAEESGVGGLGKLSEDALSLYAAMTRGKLTWEDGTPGLQELIDAKLVLPNVYANDPLYLLPDHHTVYKAYVEQAAATVAAASRTLLDLPEFFGILPHSAEDGSGVEYMGTKQQATSAITKAMAGVTSSIWTAHPKERTPEVMSRSEPDVTRKLQCGIRMRTIYPDIRHQAHMARWAAKVTGLGAKCGSSTRPSSARSSSTTRSR
ncbi:hypothetical protein ACF053_27400 [Streptomyces kanasensis]|uniref:hypothetical protein n=1 Tax=Streptomyces kanasensis TaxID=936756 RepID=UPI0036F6294B